MKVEYKTVKDSTKEMLKNVKELKNKTVEVGALRGEHAWLAHIHEYGCNIPVTPEMRKFLHAKGIHLSLNKTVIRIPERSFLRNGHDANAEKVLRQIELLIGKVVNGTISVDELLDKYGEIMSSKIKTYMTDLSIPPNSKATVKLKGSSNPLIDTGDLKESITWEIH